MAEGKRQVRKIPEATVARLPIYLRSLLEVAGDGTPTISSERLAELSGVNAAKVRKDLSYLGSYGTRGVGYDVEYLLFQMSRELGLTQDWHVVIVGHRQPRSRPRQLRRLHRAGLPGGRAGRRRPARSSAPTSTASPCATSTSSPAIAAEHQVAIGIIATPAGAAQEVADRLVAAGVTLDPQLRPHHRDRAARGVAAQGRPGGRAADPQLLPAAPRQRRRGHAGAARPGRRATDRVAAVPVDQPLYPVNLVVAGRRCLVVGGGRVAQAEGRGACVEAGAHVTVVAPDIDPPRSAALARRARRAALPPGRGGRLPARDRRHRRPRGQPAGLRRRRGGRRLGQQRRRPGPVQRHPARPGAPGPAARHRVHRRPQPGRRRVAPQAPRRHLRDRNTTSSSTCWREARDEVRAQGVGTERFDWQQALDSGMLDLIRAGRLDEAKERFAGVSVVVIGLNHRTAPLDLLERMTVGDGQLPKALHDLATRGQHQRGGGALDLQPHRGLRGRRAVPRRLQRHPRLPRRARRSCRPRTSPTTSTSTTTRPRRSTSSR